MLFRPKAGAAAETAEALCKVWMEISQQNQLPWLRSDVFCDGIIRSVGSTTCGLIYGLDAG